MLAHSYMPGDHQLANERCDPCCHGSVAPTVLTGQFYRAVTVELCKLPVTGHKLPVALMKLYKVVILYAKLPEFKPWCVGLEMSLT